MNPLATWPLVVALAIWPLLYQVSLLDEGLKAFGLGFLG